MKKLMKATSVGAGAAALAAAAACVLVAPRRRNEELHARWEQISRYRFAHRGLYDNTTLAPENSLMAFRFAREWGYGSELDVHLTADGRLVVIHDSDLKRACGVEGIVEDETYDQLRELRLFGTQERIPLFEDVLDVYESGEGTCPPLVVEVKVYRGNYVPLMEKVMALLDAHTVPYCVESFDPRAIYWLRRNRPDVIRGQLSEHFVADKESNVGFLRGLMAGALAINVLSRPDFVAYRFEHRHHPAMLLACGPLGAWRVYWTVGTEEDLDAADLKDAVSIFEGFNPAPQRDKQTRTDRGE